MLPLSVLLSMTAGGTGGSSTTTTGGGGTTTGGESALIFAVVLSSSAVSHAISWPNTQPCFFLQRARSTLSTLFAGGGGGTTTSGGGGGPTGADVYATFFADESCTKPAFALNVSGCEDLSPQVSNICADLSIPALLCPYVSVRATCSNGYVKGTVYFSEIKTNGGGTCGTNANKISIPVLPENKCYSIGLDGFGIGFEGVCN